MALNMNKKCCLCFSTILIIVIKLTLGENLNFTKSTTPKTTIVDKNNTTATCSVNNNSSSCLNSTRAEVKATTISVVTNSSTLILPETTTTNPITEFPKIKNYISYYTPSDKDICPCNLKINNYCDINCCCDQDCSYEDRLVFDHCEEEFHHYDTRYCDYLKYIYINNTQHEWHVNQNGLFCVVRSNFPPTHVIQKKNPLKSFEEAEFQRSSKYSWPRYDNNDVEIYSGAFYSYGQSLWIVKDRKLQTLKITKYFLSTHCILRHDVEFLVDIKSSCIQTSVGEDNQELDARSYFENVTVIGAPQNFSLSAMKNLKNCSRLICISVSPKSCDPYFENCVDLPRNSSRYKPTCRWSLTKNEFSCYNLAKGLKYIIHHNGTRGIEKVHLLITLENITFNASDNIEFGQSFEINFTWSNRSLNYSSYLSGNPGYLIGKPVLIAEIVAIKNKTDNTTFLKIFRDPLDFRTNFLVLPDSDNSGNCILNRNRYLPIEFGYNMYTKCDLEESVKNYRNISANFLCAAVQNVIFKYWSLRTKNYTLNDTLVGNFGNANVHRIHDWSKILFKRDLQDIINRTWGHFDSDKKSVTCGNITTLLILGFYHSRVDFENVINQEKILAATVEFDHFRNVSFEYDGGSKFVNFSLRIRAQVAFFDITSEKIRKLVDPPTLNIRLPSDFFYPFVKIKNAGQRNGGYKMYAFLVFLLVCSIF